MFNNFSEEARKIIILAKSEMQDLNHPYVSSEHLLLAILKSNNSVSTRLKKYNITYDKFKEEIIKIIGKGNKKSEWVLYTPMLKTILEKAILISNDSNVDVTIDNLFEALLDEGEGVAIRILLSMNINLDDLYNDFVKSKPRKNHKKKTILDEASKIGHYMYLAKNKVQETLYNTEKTGILFNDCIFLWKGILTKDGKYKRFLY